MGIEWPLLAANRHLAPIMGSRGNGQADSITMEEDFARDDGIAQMCHK